MSCRTRQTRHAGARLQQRAIPPILLDWLIAYGARAPAGDGCERIYFDKQGHRRLQRDLGLWAYGRLETKLDTYAVVNRDGTVVTAGYRVKRVTR
jgi:hypothetical protein